MNAIEQIKKKEDQIRTPNFEMIKPLLSVKRIYTNSRDVANVNGIQLKMWDVIVAALVTRLNLFFVGEAGPGKTQISNDIMNSIFNGNALDLRGSLDINLNGLFTRMDLDKLSKMKGKTDDVTELTEKVNFNLALIDELNRCPPVLQNQFFNITDGYIEFKGKKVYLGKPGASNYFIGIATGNLGNGEFMGTFSIDNALRDRLHLTIDFDYYYPLPMDTLNVSMNTTDPRVKISEKNDLIKEVVSAYEQTKVYPAGMPEFRINSSNYFDAWLTGQFLDHGIDYIDSVNIDSNNKSFAYMMSKRMIKNVYPDILVQKGANAAGNMISFVKPFTIRGVNKTMSLAIGLAAVASARTGAEFKLDYNTVLEAYRLVLPYSGALTTALIELEGNYGNPNIAADNVVKEVAKEVNKGIEASLIAIKYAAQGELKEKHENDIPPSWEFAKQIARDINNKAIAASTK